MSDPVSKLSQRHSALLVIDLQEKLLPAMLDSPEVTANASKMIRAAQLLQLPILATEQYPAGLGPTCPPIREAMGEAQMAEKLAFSACVEPILKSLHASVVRQVLIVGIEAHVCVQQTVLDLLRHGYLPYVCADAISSRRALDRDTAIERMRQAGAIITTTESAIFELLGQAGTPLFKEILKIIK
jgi:nicotinamidase-related amidase